MDIVRIGIIGIGNMGSNHMNNIEEKQNIPGAKVTAVCDLRKERLDIAREKYGDGMQYFTDADEMMKSGLIDAVIIATPHYAHPVYALKALKAGLHVLCEKPAGVDAKAVAEVNAYAESCGLVYGVMFNQRTNPLYQKLREMVQSGELGAIKRVNWIITDWYRSQSYYDSGGWRATWTGEGGGVLMNQDPHQLDLMQWIFGMPKRVRAFMYYGKFHNIEVEDDVTAYLEYDNGATGLFVTGTGEAPGTNRLEVSCDMGKVVVEKGEIKFWKNEMSEREFNATWDKGFGSPKNELVTPEVTGENLQHTGILRNWTNAILNGTPLMAPGVEGINGVRLANAFYVSAWTDSWVDMPADEELYLKLLEERKAASTGKSVEEKTLDVDGTYGSK